MAKAKQLCSWDNVVKKGHTIFTQGNVNEVLPGVTTPLYADLASWWDYYWCDGVANELGVSDQLDIAPPPRFNQLGFMGGRWTVNVDFNIALSSTWSMGGTSMLQSFFEGGDAIVAQGGGASEATRKANEIINERWNNAAKYRRQIDRASRASYVATRRARLHALTDAQLVDAIDKNIRLEGQTFITHYYVTVGGGEYASLLGGLLERYLKKYPPEWVTTLTSGLRDVESSRPGKAIWDLSRLVASRKTLANQFRAMDAKAIVARLAAPPDAEWEALATAWRAFITEFGWRGQRESDPATPTWDENPDFVIGAIQGDLDAPAGASPYVREERAAKKREKLEAQIFKRIPEADLPGFKKQLATGQVLAREREAVKATWARISRNYRPLVLELGRRLAERGILDRPDDVWFLRWAELQGVDSLTAKGARKNVTARRAEYERLKDFMMPDGVYTWPADLVAIGANVDTAQKEFQALGVSPGVAEGPARVVLSAYDDADVEPGEILVAPVTDAPWTPLFIPAAAVVVEMGGVLSHAATVAREFGIPGVSGVKDATRIIKTGQRIRVDGNTGKVTILSK